ncbi:MAG: hypothetical protein ABSE51_11445 [Terracidiphilus sp.]|jgi:hypothetical protein
MITKLLDNELRFALAAILGTALICVMAIPARAQAPRVVTPPTPADRLKYPPESSAIDSSYWDLLYPWNVDTQMRPMYSLDALRQATNKVESLLKSGLSEEDAWSQSLPATSQLMYQFEFNKTIVAVTPDQLRARLTVTPAQSSDANLSIHIAKAEMIGDYKFGSPNLGPVSFSCETTGPVCTFTWPAASEDKKYWGALNLQVTLTVAGAPDTFVIGRDFYSSPMVAGQFTGNFEKKIVNGSLVIDAGVKIQKHMACFVSANLYSVDSATPLQHVERRMVVDPSMKTISFTFFGKIFRDYGDAGTFRIQDLKGQCENLAYPAEWFINSQAHEEGLEEFLQKGEEAPSASEPTQIYFARDDYSYTTHSYPNSIFSGTEWQSPEKTRRLELEKKAADDDYR